MADTPALVINKSLLTNVVAAALLVVSYFVPAYHTQVFNMGVFALSGAVTNWLAGRLGWRVWRANRVSRQFYCVSVINFIHHKA